MRLAIDCTLQPAWRGLPVHHVQHAGVDEGAIVKVHGEHLAVLRRGRLFTVRIGADELQPVAALNVFGPDIDPAGSRRTHLHS